MDILIPGVYPIGSICFFHSEISLSFPCGCSSHLFPHFHDLFVNSLIFWLKVDNLRSHKYNILVNMGCCSPGAINPDY